MTFTVGKFSLRLRKVRNGLGFVARFGGKYAFGVEHLKRCQAVAVWVGTNRYTYPA